MPTPQLQAQLHRLVEAAKRLSSPVQWDGQQDIDILRQKVHRIAQHVAESGRIVESALELQGL